MSLEQEYCKVQKWSNWIWDMNVCSAFKMTMVDTEYYRVCKINCFCMKKNYRQWHYSAQMSASEILKFTEAFAEDKISLSIPFLHLIEQNPK